MNQEDRKAAIRSYKERKPEMGIIEFLCVPTGERFSKAVKDTKEINRHRFQLEGDLHPNKHLQQLWDQHGEGSFQICVERILEYKDPKEDQTEELETLWELYVLDHPDAQKI